MRCLLASEHMARHQTTRELRRSKVALVVRDHRLALFKSRERELDQQISELEVCCLRAGHEASTILHLVSARIKFPICKLRQNLIKPSSSTSTSLLLENWRTNWKMLRVDWKRWRLIFPRHKRPKLLCRCVLSPADKSVQFTDRHLDGTSNPQKGFR